MYASKFAISLSFKFCSFTKFYSHATFYVPYTKAKAVYKPFDTDRIHAKARAMKECKRELYTGTNKIMICQLPTVC